MCLGGWSSRAKCSEDLREETGHWSMSVSREAIKKGNQHHFIPRPVASCIYIFHSIFIAINGAICFDNGQTNLFASADKSDNETQSLPWHLDRRQLFSNAKTLYNQCAGRCCMQSNQPKSTITINVN